MNNDNKIREVSPGFHLMWQIFSFVCAFFACSFVTGIEPIFCALAAAMAASLCLSGRSPASFLGTLAGGLLGYAFALWTAGGGVQTLVIPADLFAKGFFAQNIVFTLNYRIFGAVYLVLIFALSLITVFCVRRGISRAVCVAANTLAIGATQVMLALTVLWEKYSVISLELIREKTELAVSYAEQLIRLSLGNSQLSGDALTVVERAARNSVYTLPSMVLVYCGVVAFLSSFVAKRLMKKSGAVENMDKWVFMPGPVSAAVYVITSVILFLFNIFEPTGAAVYGLEIIGDLLSAAFFMTGLTAFRYLHSRRKQMRMGGNTAVWVIVCLILGIVPIVGVAFVAAMEIRRRTQNPNNEKM